MGLTSDAMGIKAVDSGLFIQKTSESDQIIALAGNPNVGKSTVFNQLTGLNQHTGNWPGKTVVNAQGRYQYQDKGYVLVDIPGTYSLMAHSTEEEVARDFICFGDADAIIVVCDATCLERNLNLVLQTLEITQNVIVCVNLMDEAEKKHISIDFSQLEKSLGIPVISTKAARGTGLDQLMHTIANIERPSIKEHIHLVEYTTPVEQVISILEPIVAQKLNKKLYPRWISLKLLEGDQSLISALYQYTGVHIESDSDVKAALIRAKEYLELNNITQEQLNDTIVSCIIQKAEQICSNSVFYHQSDYNSMNRKIDKILTSRRTGIPVMLILLSIVFWLTISGSNYPSQVLSYGLFWIQDRLLVFAGNIHAPEWLANMLILGIYRVAAWVVSVMLPPMGRFKINHFWKKSLFSWDFWHVDCGQKNIVFWGW